MWFCHVLHRCQTRSSRKRADWLLLPGQFSYLLLLLSAWQHIPHTTNVRGAGHKGWTFPKQTVLSWAVLRTSENLICQRLLHDKAFWASLLLPNALPDIQSVYSSLIEANETAATRAGQTTPFPTALITLTLMFFAAPHSKLATGFGKESQDHFVREQFLAQQELTKKISFKGW